MAKEVTPDDFRKQLERLNKAYDKLRKDPIKINFDASNAADQMKTLDTLLKSANERIADMDEGFGGLHETIASIVEDIGGMSAGLKDGTKAYKSLESIANKFKDDALEINLLSKKEISDNITKIAQEQSRLEFAKEMLDKKVEAGEKLSTKEQDLLNNIKKGYDVGGQVLELAEKRLKTEEEILSATGLTGKSLRGMSGVMKKMGLGDYSEAFGDAAKAAREQAKSIKDGGGNMKSLGSQAKIFSKGMTTLTTKLNKEISAAVVAASAKFLWDAAKGFSKAREELSKAFALGVDDANKLREEITASAVYSGKWNVNIENTSKAYSLIQKSLEGQLPLNREQTAMAAEMTEYLGFSEEATAGMVRQAALGNEDLRDRTEMLRGNVMIMKLQTGVALNEQQVMEDIAKASSDIRFNLDGNPQALAAAAFQARSLGMEMSDIKSAAEGTLQFESSIEQEIRTELMLGKNINLEKLRYAALTGDIETQTKEMSRLIAEDGKKLKGNTLLQKQYAGMLNISVEQLMKAVEQQELLGGKFKTMEDAQAKFNDLKNQGLSDEKIAEELGSKKLKDQLAAAAAQKKFGAAMTKLKDIFTKLVEGPLGKMLDKFANLLIKISETKLLMDGISKTVGTIVGMKFLNFGGLFRTLKNIWKFIAKIFPKAGKQGLKSAMEETVKTGVKETGSKMLGTMAGGLGQASSKAGEKGIEKMATETAKGGIGAMFKKALNPKVLGKILKFPIISTIIEALFMSGDIEEIVKEGGGKSKIYSGIGKRAMEGIGGIAGGALGGFLGSFIPIPFVGTLLGAVAGDFIGRWAMGHVADSIGTEGFGKAVAGLWGVSGDIERGQKVKGKDVNLELLGEDTIQVGRGGMQAGTALGRTDEMVEELTSIKNSIKELLTKDSNLYMNSDKVGYSMGAVWNYKLQ